MPVRDSVPAYRLGLPAWAFPGWRDRFFEAVPSQLASYARVFNAVEGNTAFYGVPDAATVRSWVAAVAGKDFHFSFKLPRTVTHAARPSGADLDAFLTAIAPLSDKLGPVLVQFPAAVGPHEIARFEPVFEKLVANAAVGGRCVLEVRHPAFFDRPEHLGPLLERHGFGRVTLDARALYAGDPTHPEVVDALHEKPNLPILDGVVNGIGFVRLVLHPEAAGNEPWLDEWAARAAALVSDGVDLTMMIHCPDNAHCPSFAADFNARLVRLAPDAGIAPLAPWPVPQQGSLL